VILQYLGTWNIEETERDKRASGAILWYNNLAGYPGERLQKVKQTLWRLLLGLSGLWRFAMNAQQVEWAAKVVVFVIEWFPRPIGKFCPDGFSKTIELAREVWLGKWGNGEERKQRLREREYNYEAVQWMVNVIGALRRLRLQLRRRLSGNGVDSTVKPASKEGNPQSQGKSPGDSKAKSTAGSSGGARDDAPKVQG